MNRTFRRHEILLPLRFNDGRPVPGTFLAETLLELRRHFGAVSCESSTIQGQWQHQGEVYRDELVRVFVDVEDRIETHQFFVQFKQVLKKRLDQLEIWITSHPLDLI
jgi:hypothetical protein